MHTFGNYHHIPSLHSTAPNDHPPQNNTRLTPCPICTCACAQVRELKRRQQRDREKELRRRESSIEKEKAEREASARLKMEKDAYELQVAALAPKIQAMEASWNRLRAITGADTPDGVIDYWTGGVGSAMCEHPLLQ